VTGPGYDLLVGVHVLSAVVGFGSVGVSGTYAARARSSPDPRRDAVLLRYFRPGTNWAERFLLLTPVVGGVLLWFGDRSAASEVWPWIGLGCWTCAAAMATSWCWPAEHRIQSWLAGGEEHEERPPPTLSDFRRSCRMVQWTASAISVCFAAAVVVMVGQPH
jgi:hypothetical protein